MKAVNETAEGVFANFGLTDIDPRAPVAELPLDKQQMIEIAKADDGPTEDPDPRRGHIFVGTRRSRQTVRPGTWAAHLGTTVVLITHRMGRFGHWPTR